MDFNDLSPAAKKLHGELSKAANKPPFYTGVEEYARLIRDDFDPETKPTAERREAARELVAYFDDQDQYTQIPQAETPSDADSGL